MVPWTKKYSPKSSKDVSGQQEGLQQIRDFIVNFKKQKKKAMLIYGPSGTGKTTAVHAIAKENNLEIVEVNASDTRNSEQILAVLGNAAKQQSLFSKGKVILVDEVDGIAGQQDRGGVQALAKLIEKPAFPIILAANNPWDSKFSSLRSKTTMVQFMALDYLTIYRELKRICTSEKIKAEDDVLKNIARRSGGDMRSAINDLQIMGEISSDSLQELSDRDRTESVMQALMKVFKTTQPDIALPAFDNVQEDTDQVFLWIDENLPKEYTKPKDLARAYDALSLADVYRGRIRRWQHWRFLVYINNLLTAGVALGKDEKYHSFVKYGPTTRLLKIWQANQRQHRKKQIAQKIADKTYSSQKEILKSTMPYMKAIFKNKEMAERISEELGLDKEEVEWLRK